MSTDEKNDGVTNWLRHLSNARLNTYLFLIITSIGGVGFTFGHHWAWDDYKSDLHDCKDSIKALTSRPVLVILSSQPTIGGLK